MPKLSVAQRKQQEYEETLTGLIAQGIQLQRTVWQLVKQNGGSAVIDQEAITPLWELKYEPIEGKPNHARIVASLLPEPTAEQLETLAAKLLGTKQHPADLMKEVGLPEHPFSYVTNLLAPKVVFNNGTWISRAEYDKLPPKSPVAVMGK